MSGRFEQAMGDKQIQHDLVLLGDFVQIWCDGHHSDRDRQLVQTDGAQFGVYGSKTPTLCEECQVHLGYAEKRRAFCPQDPKPFCANCEIHCYKSQEREWHREMMRYSGPKSWRKGHAIDGVRHMLETRKYKAAKRRSEHTTSKKR